MIEYNDLYSNLFCDLARSHEKIEIISGYASPTFFKSVLDEFPHLKITLYIGMSDEGISINSHLKYKEIQGESNAFIYYQTNKLNSAKPNHIKAYRFSKGNSQRIFVGSANFTENGFINNREILTEISNDLSELFEEQKTNSILCSDPNITDYINFTVSEVHNSREFGQDEFPPVELAELGDQKFIYTRESNGVRNRLYSCRQNIDKKYHKYFKVNIALNASSNNRWRSTGINGALTGEESLLKYSLDGKLYDLFPKNQVITIYTEDDKILKAKLVSDFDLDLTLIDETWYDYTVSRLGIEFGIPLSNESLLQLKCNCFEFERINESEYLMWLAH